MHLTLLLPSEVPLQLLALALSGTNLLLYSLTPPSNLLLKSDSGMVSTEYGRPSPNGIMFVIDRCSTYYSMNGVSFLRYEQIFISMQLSMLLTLKNELRAHPYYKHLSSYFPSIECVLTSQAEYIPTRYSPHTREFL